MNQTPEPGRIVAAADCFLPRAEASAKKDGRNWDFCADYRKILDRKDIDAVFILPTTDHARSFLCVHACMAGKDVYAEKPLTVCIGEGPGYRQCGTEVQAGLSGRLPAADDGDEPFRVRTGPHRRDRQAQGRFRGQLHRTGAVQRPAERRNSRRARLGRLVQSNGAAAVQSAAPSRLDGMAGLFGAAR